MAQATRIIEIPDKEFIEALTHLLEVAKGTRCEDAVARVIDLWANPPMLLTGVEETPQ